MVYCVKAPRKQKWPLDLVQVTVYLDKISFNSRVGLEALLGKDKGRKETRD